MSPLELVAFVLGIVNVTLVVRRSVWNYPFGLAMVVLYARIFLDARLYSDALLQLFFFAVQLYGWWSWTRAAQRDGDVTVLRLTPAARWRWGIGCAVAALLWGFAMQRFTDAALPWADAMLAVLSVAAQLLMSRRAIENWWLWIVVDLGSLGLYAAKGLWLTMLLYAVFLALAIWGLIGWRAAERRQVVA